MTISRKENFPEVKLAAEKDKYIKTSKRMEYLGKPILTRGAWAITCGLCILAIIPLALKCILNLLDGISNRSSLKEAAKNGLAILAACIIAILAGLSILMPVIIGGRFGRAIALPITLLYYFSNNPVGKPSLKEEVGPRSPSSNEAAALKFGKNVISFPLAKNRSYPTVTGIDGVIIDSVDIPLESKDEVAEQYRIVFNASLQIYQVSFKKIMFENAELKCNTRAFNYPGITKNDKPGSSLDFVNAGIAQVYHLAKKMDWSNQLIEKNLHLYGYCFGGGVALQVAAYFKEKYDVNLLIFVDRSFTSYLAAVAGVIHTYSGLPLLFSRVLATTFLYGGGDLNLDSILAIKKLDLKKVHHLNLGHKTPAKPPTSWTSKLKSFFGIGAPIASADSILLDGVALAHGLDKEKIQCGKSTSDIFHELKILPVDHRIYSNIQSEGHFINLDELFVTSENYTLSASDYYKRVIALNSLSEPYIPASSRYTP